MSDVNVLLVDDHGILRTGLKLMLQDAGFAVVGEAADGRTALEMVRTLAIDVVVMDLRMPELNGVDATRQALAIRPGVKVIGLSANTDERSAVEMLRAGAVGYVAKEAASDELIQAIRTVMKGKVYFSPEVIAAQSAAAMAGAGGRAEPDSAFARLSPREREVLQLIAEGRATKEIARRLNFSIKTAETHRRNLMEKLQLTSVAELTKYAVREGISEL